MRDIELLRAAIDASGLTTAAFARDKVVRDHRTVRRWMAGQALPKAVRAFLRTMVPAEVPAELDATAPAPEPSPVAAAPASLKYLNESRVLADVDAAIDRDALAKELLRLGWLPPGGDDD